MKMTINDFWHSHKGVSAILERKSDTEYLEATKHIPEKRSMYIRVMRPNNYEEVCILMYWKWNNPEIPEIPEIKSVSFDEETRILKIEWTEPNDYLVEFGYRYNQLEEEYVLSMPYKELERRVYELIGSVTMEKK